MVNTVSRYEVAQSFRKYWNHIIWRGEEKTQGVYFNQKYGYLVDKTYAVRIQHDETAPPVFYIPQLDEEGEDEVVNAFPYQELKKETRKYKTLFTEETLNEEDLDRLFETRNVDEITLSNDELKDFLEIIPVKRIRDRSIFMLRASNEGVYGFLLERSGKEYHALDSIRFTEIGDVYCSSSITMNANALLHALNLFSSSSTVTFTFNSDRIKVTSEGSKPKVEAIISPPVHKKNIESIGLSG